MECVSSVRMALFEAVLGDRCWEDKRSQNLLSKNVAEHDRREIMGIFGVQDVNVHTKYLGLPLVFSHNKSEMFKYIIDNTCQRILGWKELQLSAAGKDVMIKSILHALPQYAMMCYKLPDSVCKRIASIINKFWLSVDGERSGVHWASQMKLCMPKKSCGMDFRELTIFNDALLAKQFWRLLANPESMICRVLKAKYFRDSDLLDSQLKDNVQWRGGRVESWNEIQAMDPS